MSFFVVDAVIADGDDDDVVVVVVVEALFTYFDDGIDFIDATVDVVLQVAVGMAGEDADDEMLCVVGYKFISFSQNIGKS